MATTEHKISYAQSVDQHDLPSCSFTNNKDDDKNDDYHQKPIKDFQIKHSK